MTENEAATKSTEQIDKELEEAEGDAEAEEKGEPESTRENCDAAEISAGARKEGTCEDDGTKWVVVNEKTPLKMETLEAKLLGIRIEKSIKSEFSETEVADGVWVIAEIELTNLLSGPAELSESQVIFYIDENLYTQDFDVQNGPEESSFGWSVEDIQPQGTEVGTVTFDIPEKVAKNIKKTGNLDFVNFGTEYYEPFELFEQDEVGTIRTYK